MDITKEEAADFLRLKKLADAVMSPARAPGCGAVPRRVRLSRKKGFRLPANTVSVARPHRFGNPYNWQDGLDGDYRNTGWCKGAAVDLFREWLRQPDCPLTTAEIIEKLRGKNLACWCKLDEPCHADLLLALANDEHHNINAERQP